MSVFYGIQSATSEWRGHLMLPGGQDPYGSDIIAAHVQHAGRIQNPSAPVEAVITLMDAWVLDKGQIRMIVDAGVPVCCWMPVDTAELSEADENFLRTTGAHPIAMSEHGRAALARRGIPCSYVPHGCDTNIFKPPENRLELRERLNLKGRFTVIMAGSNKDQIRKSYGESLEAFRIFRERHPEANAILLVHALRAAPTGLNLQRMAERKKIADAISFSDQYSYSIGMISQANLADLFGAGDVLLQPSYGEGFGVPAIEAMACGTPVILNDASAMTELCGSGWKVRGQPFHNEHHGESWQVPFIDYRCPECGHAEGIVAALEEAFAAWKNDEILAYRERAREFALQYDADRVLREFWVPVLAEIESLTRGATPLRPLERDRDATLARLQDAFNAGSLDAGAFGERAQKALAASAGEDLAVLVADLPAEAVAA